ncbi:hypothetical protein K439DRAFT_1615646 [Ramaria rubella]|nr:hypothetical protein K439DRAFT_1615646 [Ramaria rubella]
MGDQGGHEQEPNPVGGCPGGYGSVDVFSRRTVAWEPVSVEEGDLDHPPRTSRPDARALATQGVVKPNRATANRAPGALGKDEVLWELVYFFDNMDNPAVFVRGLAAPRAHLPSRAYEALAPSLTVPHPTQFFQGIAEQGYVWQNMPYGIDFTGDIGVYERSGTFRSWGKAQRGAWFVVLCHNDPDRRLSLVCVRVAVLGGPGFPTHAGLAVDPGIWVYVADPQLPSPARTAAGEAHASPRSAVGVSRPQPASTPSHPPHTPLRAGHSPVQALCWHVNPPEEGPYCPPPRTNNQQALSQPGALRATLHHCGCPLRPTWGRTCVVELPPPRHAQSPLPARRLSKRACSASRGPPGEDAQAVHSSEPYPIVGGRPTPPFDTLNSALLHVVQHAAHLGGLSLGERECVVARLHGMLVPPQGFLGVVAHLCSLVDQTSLAPWDFYPQGDGVLPWLLPWVRILISWVREDMRMAPGSDHRGAIVNMYLELSRTEWWALSDWCEVLSEWCKGASVAGVNVRPGVRVTVRVCSNGWLLQ